ncbi:uncharacterized protein P174DRAFT_390637 [Aspergillus novofumigatus IBT 16806]|uniref:F-box domain-containing protein n=1 Tax=Aspergillus novofumigatus (strain IBT 16806) TaxID=1392255 RepID=A0A2I1C440_ASPN1|nr:uncharacterized protein P174DRAFT_390637 [Aspergillus novofumigatus IBT 16806]PKX92404.1 hypothetical protein P174DRAFT_390637 [Aspergillus novofumigatus IBT 16806]
MASTTTFLNLPVEIHLLIREYLDPASAVALKNANKYLRSTIAVDTTELELEEWEAFYITLEMWPEWPTITVKGVKGCRAEVYGVSLGDDGKDTVMRGFCARNCGLSTLCIATFIRTSQPYSVRPSAIHILLLLRRARRIHHDYKEQKQSIKDEGKRYKRLSSSFLRCRSSRYLETLILC